uniref:Uncharacterized protein n=1 Tax=Ditylenchus dipsaci TaxID=166011 RepID=A0A915EB27_9BILA
MKAPDRVKAKHIRRETFTAFAPKLAHLSFFRPLFTRGSQERINQFLSSNKQQGVFAQVIIDPDQTTARDVRRKDNRIDEFESRGLAFLARAPRLSSSS